MLTGVSKEKAIKALCNGKQVLVCDRSIRNGKVIPMVSLDNYLDGLDFLMDVPAVPNPEFEEAVQSMVDSGETKEESEKQEEVIPPPIKPESEMIPAEKSKKEIVLELAEQMERKDMLDYLAEKYDIKAGVSAGGQKDPE